MMFLLAGFKWVGQDILKQHVIAHDFRPPYLATRLWMEGIQPYSPDSMLGEVQRSIPSIYADAKVYPDLRWSLYPPSCFPAIAAICALPWKIASIFELLLCALSYVALIYVTARHLQGVRRLYFVAFSLAFAPFHGGFEVGNLSALAGPLACCGVLACETNPICAALVLGVATAIKPQLGGLFMLYLLLSWRRKPFLISAATFMVLLSVGIGWLRLHGADWLSAYRADLHLMVSPYGNNENSITDAGRINFQLLNLQPLFFWSTGNMHRAVALSEIILALLLCAFAWLVFRASRATPQPDELGLIALVSLLGFVATYQQYYSAVCLLPLFLWALLNWYSISGKLITVAGLLFLVPDTKLSVFVQLGEQLSSRRHQPLTQTLHNLFRSGVIQGSGATFLQQMAEVLPELFIALAIVIMMLTLYLRSEGSKPRHALRSQA